MKLTREELAHDYLCGFAASGSNDKIRESDLALIALAWADALLAACPRQPAAESQGTAPTQGSACFCPSCFVVATKCDEDGLCLSCGSTVCDWKELIDFVLADPNVRQRCEECNEPLMAKEPAATGAKACEGFRCGGYTTAAGLTRLPEFCQHEYPPEDCIAQPGASECKCANCGLGYSACMASREQPIAFDAQLSADVALDGGPLPQPAAVPPVLEPAYSIERNGDGCSKCAAGTTWDVIFAPTGTALGTSYGGEDGEEQAQDMADSLNEAYEHGRGDYWTLRARIYDASDVRHDMDLVEGVAALHAKLVEALGEVERLGNLARQAQSDYDGIGRENAALRASVGRLTQGHLSASHVVGEMNGGYDSADKHDRGCFEIVIGYGEKQKVEGRKEGHAIAVAQISKLLRLRADARAGRLAAVLNEAAAAICDLDMASNTFVAVERGWLADLQDERDTEKARADALEAERDKLRAEVAALKGGQEPVYFVFDGPPGPEAGRFVEVETVNGQGRRVGEWEVHPSGGGLWRLGPVYAAPVAKVPDATWVLRYTGVASEITLEWSGKRLLSAWPSSPELYESLHRMLVAADDKSVTLDVLVRPDAEAGK